MCDGHARARDEADGRVPFHRRGMDQLVILVVFVDYGNNGA
jgi:hypothetical protein